MQKIGEGPGATPRKGAAAGMIGRGAGSCPSRAGRPSLPSRTLQRHFQADAGALPGLGADANAPAQRPYFLVQGGQAHAPA
jgi:hypothetical protein